jgi:hypothetical protein
MQSRLTESHNVTITADGGGETFTSAETIAMPV